MGEPTQDIAHRYRPATGPRPTGTTPAEILTKPRPDRSQARKNELALRAVIALDSWTAVVQASAVYRPDYLSADYDELCTRLERVGSTLARAGLLGG